MATADRMVGHHLREGPVLMAKARTRNSNSLRIAAPRLGLERNLELDIDGPTLSVAGAIQVSERLGILRRAPPRTTEWRKRIQRYDPRRNRGREILGLEWPQRGRLPGLNVARRPVVQQTDAENMILGPVDQYGRALFIADANEDAEFQLIIETRAGGQFRRAPVGGHDLSARPAHRLTRQSDARRAAMIGDRHPVEIRRHPAVPPQQPCDVAGVIDRSIKVGVIANVGGQAIFDVGLRDQAGAQSLPVRVARSGEQIEHRVPQRTPSLGPHSEERVESRSGTGGGRSLRPAGQLLLAKQFRHVDDLIAQRNSGTEWLVAGSTSEDRIR